VQPQYNEPAPAWQRPAGIQPARADGFPLRGNGNVRRAGSRRPAGLADFFLSSCLLSQAPAVRVLVRFWDARGEVLCFQCGYWNRHEKNYTHHGDQHLPYYQRLTYFRITLYIIDIEWLSDYFTALWRPFSDTM